MVVRDGERSKEAILSAAEDLFARQGFEGTSMQEIGEAAGVARSTPAYFFRSKEALYEAVLARVVAVRRGSSHRRTRGTSTAHPRRRSPRT
jgi:AcrR family transcriptional regulator